jgi:hypothetical protein
LGKNLKIWGTPWDHDEKHVGNTWEQGKKQKKRPITPHPKQKNWAHHECMLNLSISCMKFLYPKLLGTIFGLG